MRWGVRVGSFRADRMHDGRGVVRKPLCVFARSCYDTKILPYTISLIPTSRRARVTPVTVVANAMQYAILLQ